MSDDSAANHATIRETYDLVSDTRQELNERIDGLGQKIDSFVTTSEHRLTVLETHQSAQAERLGAIDNRLDDHGRMIGMLKDKQREDESATEAITEQTKARWATHTTAITVAASALLAAATICSLFGIKL